MKQCSSLSKPVCPLGTEHYSHCCGVALLLLPRLSHTVDPPQRFTDSPSFIQYVVTGYVKREVNSTSCGHGLKIGESGRRPRVGCMPQWVHVPLWPIAQEDSKIKTLTASIFIFYFYFAQKTAYTLKQNKHGG